MNEYLPIGSVVRLNKSDKTLMIYGRKQTHLESGNDFDYTACLYPEGYITDELTIFFNSSDISEVVFKGYATREDINFQSDYLGVEASSMSE